MYKLLNIIICTLLLQACNSSIANNDQPPVVEIDPNANLCSADEIFDSYNYTILETTDESLLSQIKRIDINERHILIMSGSEIFVFNRDGSFVSSFDKYGQGPGEYTYVWDIKFMGDDILINTDFGILRYSITGDYIGTYKLDYRYFYMAVNGNDIWLSSQSNNKSYKEFARYNTIDKEISCQLLDFDRIGSLINYNTQFLYHNENRLLVSKQFDTSVYGIDCKNCTIKKLWTYDFKTEKKLSDFDPNLSFCELSDLTRNIDVVTHLGILYENGNTVYQTTQLFKEFAYFNYIYKFDKTDPANTGKLFRVGLTNHENFPFLCLFPPMIYKDYLVTAIDADHVLSIADTKGISTFKKKGLTEDSNPVLFFHHFK